MERIEFWQDGMVSPSYCLHIARMAMSLSWWVDVHIVQQDIVLIRNHGMDTESRTCFVVSAEHCNTTWSVTSVAAAYTQRI